MTFELTLLGFTLVLTLFQIMVPAILRNRETGIAYNAGPRDEPAPPPGKLTGRLERAKTNLLETLPVFMGAVLIAHVAGREGALTMAGTALYLLARLIYVPLYALGVPYLRSCAFLAAMAGIGLILLAVLVPV
ncbi:MAPEG family protein [Ancylobacter lacus]|uniref:MAPEG family protein n=1 Tax=Ancylobacter lacus TaxID=2579970 RepID=UPI001BCE6D91|nr:MAPEG family protein [Ancylobacter lacus]MBS7537448.1 MAPEG family protein [Ancylobacter lacus]